MAKATCIISNLGIKEGENVYALLLVPSTEGANVNTFALIAPPVFGRLHQNPTHVLNGAALCIPRDGEKATRIAELVSHFSDDQFYDNWQNFCFDVVLLTLYVRQKREETTEISFREEVRQLLLNNLTEEELSHCDIPDHESEFGRIIGGHEGNLIELSSDTGFVESKKLRRRAAIIFSENNISFMEMTSSHQTIVSEDPAYVSWLVGPGPLHRRKLWWSFNDVNKTRKRVYLSFVREDVFSALFDKNSEEVTNIAKEIKATVCAPHPEGQIFDTLFLQSIHFKQKNSFANMCLSFCLRNTDKEEEDYLLWAQTHQLLQYARNSRQGLRPACLDVGSRFGEDDWVQQAEALAVFTKIAQRLQGRKEDT